MVSLVHQNDFVTLASIFKGEVAARLLATGIFLHAAAVPRTTAMVQ